MIKNEFITPINQIKQYELLPKDNKIKVSVVLK